MEKRHHNYKTVNFPDFFPETMLCALRWPVKIMSIRSSPYMLLVGLINTVIGNSYTLPKYRLKYATDASS